MRQNNILNRYIETNLKLVVCQSAYLAQLFGYLNICETLHTMSSLKDNETGKGPNANLSQR